MILVYTISFFNNSNNSFIGKWMNDSFLFGHDRLSTLDMRRKRLNSRRVATKSSIYRSDSSGRSRLTRCTQSTIRRHTRLWSECHYFVMWCEWCYGDNSCSEMCAASMSVISLKNKSFLVHTHYQTLSSRMIKKEKNYNLSICKVFWALWLSVLVSWHKSKLQHFVLVDLLLWRSLLWEDLEVDPPPDAFVDLLPPCEPPPAAAPARCAPPAERSPPLRLLLPCIIGCRSATEGMSQAITCSWCHAATNETGWRVA